MVLFTRAFGPVYPVDGPVGPVGVVDLIKNSASGTMVQSMYTYFVKNTAYKWI